MQPKLYRQYLLLLGFLLLLSPLMGQVNLRVGYNLGFVQPEVHTQVYEQFNLDRPWLAKPLKSYQSLNGLQLGLRYTWDNWLGLEFTWHNQYHRQNATGANPIGNTAFSQTVSYRFSSLGLGLENFIGPISFGASINYDRFNFKVKATKVELTSVQKNFGWSSHFFVGYNFEGNSRLKISLRPYAHILWHRVNLDRLNQSLNPTDSRSNLEEDFSSFGFMLVFYNGG